MGVASIPTAATVGVALVAYLVYSALAGLNKNIENAKKSGLPYIVSPVSPFSLPAQVTHKLWIPIVQTCLPRSWWENWITLILPDWSYIHNHKIFARHGPAFFVVSPYASILLTDNAEVIRQVTQRREHFPKLVETYEVLKQFGDNTLTTEGPLWRIHRRATAASFNERNAALVFAVAAEQTRGMLDKWMADQEGRSRGPGGGEGDKAGSSSAPSPGPIRTIDRDTMRLALNIIGYVGFGLRMLWPGQALPEGTDPRLVKYTSLEPVDGHTLSFIDTIATLLERILWLLVLPQWLLKLLPLKRTQEAAESYTNYVAYMNELLDEKLQQLRAGSVDDAEPGMDIMGQLVRSTYGDASSSTDDKETKAAKPASRANGKPSSPSPSLAPPSPTASAATMGRLGRPDILGNAFIMLVAGHETTANALHFTLLELAAHPPVQRALQRDLDALLGDRDPRDWAYEATVNALIAGTAGACMNETLRKMPSVVEVPKKVAAAAARDGSGGGGGQTVTLDGRTVLLPEGTAISLVAVAAHRNPRYWPTTRSRVTGAETDLDDYVPARWFRSRPGHFDDNDEDEEEGGWERLRVEGKNGVNGRSPSPASSQSKSPSGEGEGGYDNDEYDADMGGYAGPDTSARLFRPERGAYIPFSDGARSCLGRRIAQVEIVAALAVLFQRYSLELDVGDFEAGEGETRDREELAKLYGLAQERCRKRIEGATSVLTLKMQGGEEDVPVRLVRRGEERFVSWVD